MNALSPIESEGLFRSGTNQIAVELKPLPAARMIWLNHRVMRCDPQFARVGGTVEAYAAHLLRSCSYSVPKDDSLGVSEQARVWGYADRYGGVGIGRNGGSGRAVVLNGYQVKGIGRTPLVSIHTDEAHASGGAYLEECVRETILSEIVAAEFPHGAIPTLAIIATGEVQVWGTESWPEAEQRCLLVRPSFVRPAHFERAPQFISENPKEGSCDSARVRQFFAAAIKLWGRENLSLLYQEFWPKWAEQLAYAFVHRLPHGGNSSSNICLDGSLLDFGGMTAIPSWARATLSLGGPPIGAELQFLFKAVHDGAPFFSRYLDASFGAPEKIHKTLALASERYQFIVSREILRLCGLSTAQSNSLLDREHRNRCYGLIGRMIGHYQREQFTILDGIPHPKIAWEMGRLWSSDTPEHLVEMRTFLVQELGLASPMTVAREHALAILERRCNLRSASRSALYRERMKSCIFQALEAEPKRRSMPPTQGAVEVFVAEMIARNRRDCLYEPDDAIPIGFAQNPEASHAIFECLLTGNMFALREWPRHGADQQPEYCNRLWIMDLQPGKIKFKDPSVGHFSGYIALVPQQAYPSELA